MPKETLRAALARALLAVEPPGRLRDELLKLTVPAPAPVGAPTMSRGISDALRRRFDDERDAAIAEVLLPALLPALLAGVGDALRDLANESAE